MMMKVLKKVEPTVSSCSVHLPSRVEDIVKYDYVSVCSIIIFLQVMVTNCCSFLPLTLSVAISPDLKVTSCFVKVN